MSQRPREGQLFLLNTDTDVSRTNTGQRHWKMPSWGLTILRNPALSLGNEELVTPVGTARGWLENRCGGFPHPPKTTPSLLLAGPVV